MGNCQTIDAAALVIQHPDGRIERLYWPVSANEVMRANPGHYVSLIIPLSSPEEEENQQRAVRVTRVKLLRPHDTLALGHAYKLITTEEVVNVLRAKKYEKMKRQQPELAAQMEMVSGRQSSGCEAEESPAMDKNNQGMKRERHHQKTSTNQVAGRPKSWRPSLQSITETAS